MVMLFKLGIKAPRADQSLVAVTVTVSGSPGFGVAEVQAAPEASHLTLVATALGSSPFNSFLTTVSIVLQVPEGRPTRIDLEVGGGVGLIHHPVTGPIPRGVGQGVLQIPVIAKLDDPQEHHEKDAEDDGELHRGHPVSLPKSFSDVISRASS